MHPCCKGHESQGCPAQYWRRSGCEAEKENLRKVLLSSASFGVAFPCVWKLILQGGIPTIEFDGNLVNLSGTSFNVGFEALSGSSNK